MAYLFSQLFMTLILQKVIWALISGRYLNGLLNGKRLWIQILPNKLKKLFFHEKWSSLVTLSSNSITWLSKMLPHRNNFVWFFDKKLNFNSHLKEEWLKFNKGIGVIKKLQNILPRQALLTVHKSFFRPHRNYGDLIYGQPKSESFVSKTRISYIKCSFRYNRSNKRYFSN